MLTVHGSFAQSRQSEVAPLCGEGVLQGDGLRVGPARTTWAA